MRPSFNTAGPCVPGEHYMLPPERQVARYLDGAELDEGWLVMFDLRRTRPWPERLASRTAEVGEKRVHVIGC